jgi:hypothetical protein
LDEKYNDVVKLKKITRQDKEIAICETSYSGISYFTLPHEDEELQLFMMKDP